MIYTPDTEELEKAIDSVDTAKYPKQIDINIFRTLIERYYLKKSFITKKFNVSWLIKECAESFTFELDYAYSVAAYSFLGNHNEGNEKFPIAKQVLKELKKHREENISWRQTSLESVN